MLLAQARLGEAHCVGIGVGEAQRQSVAQRFQGLPSQLECAGHDVSLGRDGLVELAEGRVCGQRDGHTPDWPADDARYHLQVLQGVGFREGEHDQWGAGTPSFRSRCRWFSPCKPRIFRNKILPS